MRFPSKVMSPADQPGDFPDRRTLRISVFPQDRFRQRIAQIDIEHLDAAEIDQRLSILIPKRHGCDALSEKTEIERSEAFRHLLPALRGERQ